MRALLVVTVPCDAARLFAMMDILSQGWEREHPGQTMTTAHMETRETEFGPAVIVWDEPVG